MIPEIENEQLAEIVARLLSWAMGGYTWMVGEQDVATMYEDKVWVGNISVANNWRTLKAMGITHIVCVTQFGDAAKFFPNDFIYRVIKAQDVETTQLDHEFDPTSQFINQSIQEGGRVLVHCNAGKSRSITLVMAWLMHSKGLSVEEAMKYVQVHRPEALPNKSFLHQLEKYNPPSSSSSS